MMFVLSLLLVMVREKVLGVAVRDRAGVKGTILDAMEATLFEYGHLFREAIDRTNVDKSCEIWANIIEDAMIDGVIVKTGGPELALELEDRGYDWLDAAA